MFLAICIKLHEAAWTLQMANGQCTVLAVLTENARGPKSM
jgi:hypothetical protein